MMELRKRLDSRYSSLVNERSSWVSHWSEISDYLLPRSGRYFAQNRNNGEKRHNEINDSTGTRALRILAAGMMSGMTSPARPWFRLTTSDPDLDESSGVKLWLSDVTRIMQMIFAKSNTYRSLHTMYEELGAFGTAASIVVPDYDSVLHHHPLTVGEYAIAQDWQGRVNTLYREFEMTVGQLVGEFGKDAVSNSVRTQYDRGNLDTWVTVRHAIEPRRERDTTKRDNLNMPFMSVYYEAGGEREKILRESGFKEFPALVPRWKVVGSDVYGESPGMEALGDVKQLQHEQLRKSQVIDYQTAPPLVLPTSMRNQQVEMLPGGRSYADVAGNSAITSLFQVNLNLQHLLADVQDVRERITGAFYADLFLMLANDTRSGITATEVAERHEEKLLMLGPVLERMHNEILDPFIEMTFSRMVEAGIVPPPPPELEGIELNVEFVSMLAQAQRAVATNGVDRFVGNLGAIAQFKPDVLDKFDADRWADEYADMLGVSPELIVPGEQVALIRQQRAQAQAQAAQAEQVAMGAKATRDLASADTSGQNALTDITRMFSGYSS